MISPFFALRLKRNSPAFSVRPVRVTVPASVTWAGGGVYILLNTIFMYAQTDISWMRQIDYEKKECNMQELNGFAFYVDHDNDIPAYYEYVGTPHQSQFDTLEMRGNQIKDGFRSKN